MFATIGLRAKADVTSPKDIYDHQPIHLQVTHSKSNVRKKARRLAKDTVATKALDQLRQYKASQWLATTLDELNSSSAAHAEFAPDAERLKMKSGTSKTSMSKKQGRLRPTESSQPTKDDVRLRKRDGSRVSAKKIKLLFDK